MTRVTIIGCGIVGALTAYELSQHQDLEITVLDRQPPAQGSTGAALGVLMGVISHKVKGRQWRLRWQSLQRYETLIPELEANTGQHIPYNRKGILKLLFESDSWDKWQSLLETRHGQNLPLVLLSAEQLAQEFPQLQSPGVIGAVYSERDRQLDPTALTLALVDAARQRGVQFNFEAPVDGFLTTLANSETSGYTTLNTGLANAQSNTTQSTEEHPTMHCSQVCWADASQPADVVVVTAGLGATQLTGRLQHPIEIRPVLGQALQVWMPRPLGNVHLHPVISGEDIHIVPLLKPWIDETELHPQAAEYWIGATVELPDDAGNPAQIEKSNLDKLWQKAKTFWPELEQGEIVRTWSGYRPRPYQRPAPVFDRLPGYDNILIATAHYRNGVLLAPATAQWVVEQIVGPQAV